MKKRYSKPETLCVKIKVQQMVCASNISNTSGADGLGVSAQDTEGAGITEAGARGTSIWDDED